MSNCDHSLGFFEFYKKDYGWGPWEHGHIEQRWFCKYCGIALEPMFKVKEKGNG